MLFLESLLPYRVKKSVELNGERVLEFGVINHDLNAFFYKQLKEESKIVFESEIYVVKNIVSTSNGNKAVEKYATCVHKFFDDGINNVKDELHDGSITFSDFMDFVFGDTTYNDYDIKDFFRAKNIENLGRDNRISMLKRGIDLFEFEFDLQKKDDNDVKLIVANQIGDVTDIQFRYGHNVEVIDVEVDTKNLSTHIKGYGAPGIETEYTSPNVEVFGKLDAPTVKDERFKTAATLLGELKKRIIDEPRIMIELTVDEFEKHINKITDKPMCVGDYISLIYEPFDDLNVFVRVIKIDTFYNSKLEVVNTILKITNETESFLGSYLNDVSKQIEDATKGFQQNINMARNERDITISNNYIEVLTLPVTVLEATNAAAHMTVVGESASQMLLDGYFTLDGEVLETTVKQVMFQGFNTISVNFIMTQLQEGFHNLRFYLKSEGNSFFIKQNDCTVFTTGQGLYAQLGTRLPSAYFAEEVRFDVDFEVTDYASTTLQIPLSRNIGEDVIFNVDFNVIDAAKLSVFNSGTILPIMTANDTPSPYYIVADTGDADHHGFFAVDKDKTTHWLTSEENASFTIDLGSEHYVEEYIIVAGEHDLSWTFEGSDDAVNWDVLDSNNYNFGRREEKRFAPNSAKGFRYYRWIFDNAEKVEIYELDLIGEA